MRIQHTALVAFSLWLMAAAPGWVVASKSGSKSAASKTSVTENLMKGAQESVSLTPKKSSKGATTSLKSESTSKLKIDGIPPLKLESTKESPRPQIRNVDEIVADGPYALFTHKKPWYDPRWQQNGLPDVTELSEGEFSSLSKRLGKSLEGTDPVEVALDWWKDTSSKKKERMSARSNRESQRDISQLDSVGDKKSDAEVMLDSRRRHEYLNIKSAKEAAEQKARSERGGNRGVLRIGSPESSSKLDLRKSQDAIYGKLPTEHREQIEALAGVYGNSQNVFDDYLRENKGELIDYLPPKMITDPVIRAEREILDEYPEGTYFGKLYRGYFKFVADSRKMSKEQLAQRLKICDNRDAFTDKTTPMWLKPPYNDLFLYFSKLYEKSADQSTQRKLAEKEKARLIITAMKTCSEFFNAIINELHSGFSPRSVADPWLTGQPLPESKARGRFLSDSSSSSSLFESSGEDPLVLAKPNEVTSKVDNSKEVKIVSQEASGNSPVRPSSATPKLSRGESVSSTPSNVVSLPPLPKVVASSESKTLDGSDSNSDNGKKKTGKTSVFSRFGGKGK